MANGTHFTGLAVAPVSVPDGTTYSFETRYTGKIHAIPDLTADCTFTLPRCAAGLKYELMYVGAAADAEDWIIATGATTELYKGGLVHLDADAGSGGDEVVPVYADFSNDDTMTILTPEAGTLVTLVSDGTSWLVTGQVVSASAPTFA